MRILGRTASAVIIGVAGVAATQVQAQNVNWADLTTAGTDQVTGNIQVGATSVGVIFVGPYSFANTNGGTFYWTEPVPSQRPYTGGSVTNAPPTSDIIALDQGGLKTITFSQAVTDPYLALLSWNGNAATFTQQFQTISSGYGFYGPGSFTAVTPFTFVAEGELHGIIRFNGTFTSVSFTDRTENFHAIQIGIGGVAPPSGAVPEPATWGMMLLGFGAMSIALRQRVQTRRNAHAA